MFSCDGPPFIEFSGTAQRAGRLRGASFLVRRCGADVRGGTAVFGPLYSGSSRIHQPFWTSQPCRNWLACSSR